jgi:integrase
MALRKIGKYYHVYWQDRGRQHTMSLHITDKQEALRLERQMMETRRLHRCSGRLLQEFPEITQLLSHSPREHLEIFSPRPQKGIKLAQMWEYAQERRALSKNHRKVWDKFLERMKYKYASEITPKIALEYLETYYNKGNGKTYNNVKSALNTIFRCCLVEANLQQSPFAPIVNKRVTEVDHHRNLTLEEVDRIMGSGANELIKVMVMLSRWTAQRLETCARITPDLIDWERKVIILQPGKTKRFNKWVCAPLFPPLEEYLKKIPCPGDKSYAEYYGYRENRHFGREIRQLFDKLGISDTAAGHASFHSLRGTAITWFKENGIQGEPLRSITGHETAEVEDIYARDIATISALARGQTM